VRDASRECRAIFLDGDGVLVQEGPGYLLSNEELSILPGLEPLVTLRQKGFVLIVCTNQSAVNRGLVTRLKSVGVFIDALTTVLTVLTRLAFVGNRSLE